MRMAGGKCVFVIRDRVSITSSCGAGWPPRGRGAGRRRAGYVDIRLKVTETRPDITARAHTLWV